MEANPFVPDPPAVDYPAQSKLDAQIEAMQAALLRMVKLEPIPGQHVRSGVTKNKSRPRDKSRAKMASESRRRNRSHERM